MYTIDNKILNLGVIDFSKETSNLVGQTVIQMLPMELYQEYKSKINKAFTNVIDSIIQLIPFDKNSSNKHFITIDSKFMYQDSALRREGIHLDGNFCADPEFQKKGNLCWGGTEVTGWGGNRCIEVTDGRYEIHTPFQSEFGTKMEFGQYISSNKGGIITVSDLEGCTSYKLDNQFIKVKSGGELIEEEILSKSSDKITYKKNNIYFMSSDTPHESHIIKQGNRRSLIRISLAHDYDNSLIN